LQIGKQFVVSAHVDQYLNNQKSKLLWDLLANPADKDTAHTQNLKQLVTDHPQSGLLQALLTYVGETPNLQHAAVYYNPKALYKLNKDIDGLHTVSESQLLTFKLKNRVAGYFHVGEVEHEDKLHTVADELPALVPDAGYEAAQHPATDALDIDVNAPVVEPAHKEIADPQYVEAQHLASPQPKETFQPTAPKEEQAPHIQEDTFNAVVSIDDINLAVQEYYATVMEPQTGFDVPMQFSDIYAEAFKTEYEPTPIVEAGPGPVAEIPAGPEVVETAAVETQHLASPEPQAEPVAQTKEETVFKDRKIDFNDEAEKLILNNIAATDFFVFDRAFGDKKKEEEIKAEEPHPAPVETAAPELKIVEAQHPVSPEPNIIETQHFAAPVAVAVEPTPPVTETQPVAKTAPHENISKYHDEKMPYSFMWWLDKTRKEHSGIYQPFAAFKLDTSLDIKPAEPEPQLAPPDELQQQYIESIFQLNTVEELEGAELSPVQFDPKRKEDEIIERFIQEVPQIKPPSADKLDNENKAKKSSEDLDELVTETLAQVYSDQMLYPKAIETYKKLMLKFPEKSRYFAGQIDALQKK
jgi:hypothetical protein